MVLTRAAFLSKWNTRFADNSSRDISEEDMREFKDDLLDSFYNIEDDIDIEAFNGEATGTNTYALAVNIGAAYATNHIYYVKFTNANTGASTLNINSLGAKTIVKNGATALASGDLPAGAIIALKYDGTNLQIVGKVVTESSVTLAHGTYTPTLVGVANVASSVAYVCQYMRVGNTVTVSGRIGVQATASTTNTEITLTLPIASNFGTDHDCGGVASQSDANRDMSGAIRGDITSNLAELVFKSESTSMRSFYFTFTYRII